MRIKIQLYSILRDKLPPEANGRTVLHLEEGAVLSDVLDEFGITRKIAISVNEVHVADKDHLLQDGDEVKIFSSISGG